MAVRVFFRTATTCVFLLTLLGAAACNEESGVRVSSMKFNGIKAVKPSQLKSVLATGASSKLPWGEKRYFNREQFEADLKRIVAFYHDRGFPDARISSFDVKLSPDQTLGGDRAEHLRRRADRRRARRFRGLRAAAGRPLQGA